MINYIKSVKCRQFAGTCHRKCHHKLQRAISGVRSFARRRLSSRLYVISTKRSAWRELSIPHKCSARDDNML